MVRRQISSDFLSLRDTDTSRLIDKDILVYEKLLLKNLGSNLSKYTAKELIDYFKCDNISIKGINSKHLRGFIDHMQKPRKMAYIGPKIDKLNRQVLDYVAAYQPEKKKGKVTSSTYHLTKKNRYSAVFCSKYETSNIDQLRKSITVLLS